MPEIIWAHICDKAFLGEDGRPSIIGEIDGISSPTFPVTYTPICVALRITSTKDDRFSMRSAISDDQGNRIIETEAVNIDGSQAENVLGVERGIVNFVQVFLFLDTVFPKPGVYSAEILVDDMLVHTIPLILAQTN